MESLVSSHQSTNSISDIDRRKKRKPLPSSPSTSSLRTRDGESHTRWRSDKQQLIYSAKLVQALRQVRLNSSSSSSSSSSPRGSRAVREAADRALAIAARGRTVWSRAILASRVKLKFRKQKRPRLTAVTAATASNSGSRKPPKVSVLGLKAKNLPAVQRKVRVLGRLVPGCREQPLPVILEEATDYIAALEMQVRAMSSLADLLSKYSSGSSSITPPST